jgi:hypothetical protein
MEVTDLFRRVLYFLAAVLIATIAVATWAWVNAGSSQVDTLRLELFKSALQLGGVAIIGGGIAFLYKWMEKSSDVARDKAALRREFSAKLGDMYRSVHVARRRLRAGGLSKSYNRNLSALTERQITLYQEQLRYMSDTHLTLDALEVECFYVLDGSRAEMFASTLKRMRDYLWELIGEYERLCATRLNGLDELSFDEVTKLDMFTRDHTDAYHGTATKVPSYVDGFVVLYKQLIGQLAA